MLLEPMFTGAASSSVPSVKSKNTFPVSSKIKNDKLQLKTRYTFLKPGTYFPTLRIAVQREGSAETAFARIQNLDRVRVVVK
jgi:hypothetical protein